MTKVKNSSKTVYQHLTIEEREEIACMLEKGYTYKYIGQKLCRHSSTISREIKRNGSPKNITRYRANQAQIRADNRSEFTHRKLRLKNQQTRKYVVEKLQKHYSPEQIAGRISIDLKGHKTNHESIYLFIYNERPDLAEYLVWGKRKRRKRKLKAGKRVVRIPNRVMITHRPKSVNNRKVIGHWEADTVISRKSKNTLVVIRERKSQLMYIRKIPRKTAKNVSHVIIKILSGFPKYMVRSITFDNGLENADHEFIAKTLGVKTYFCNPYRSWEKGGVENGIGLIRRYLPKKTDFNLISYRQISIIQKRLNNRPRKTLNFQTPLEVSNNCA